MNNSLRHWLRAGALCPLLVLPLTVGDALALGGALLATLLVTAIGTTLLRRCTIASQRLIICALLAALSAGVIDLLLQAFCYREAQQLRAHLPLLVIAPLLFNAPADAKLARNALDALATGGGFAAMLVATAALRCAVSGDAALVLGFFAGALGSALVDKIGGGLDASASPPPSATPRVRARVTGPLR